MSTGTEDINNLSQKNDNLKKKTEPTDNPMAITWTSNNTPNAGKNL